LLTVNKDTVIGDDRDIARGSGTVYLESVGYNGVLNSSNVALSSFLYFQKVIEFNAFTHSNRVIFNLAGLPVPH
jgi:hypothetical protein